MLYVKSNRKSRLQNHSSGKTGKVLHFSILLSVPHNWFQPRKQELPLSDRCKGRRKSFGLKLEARAELSLFDLAVCVAHTFLPEWGIPLALNS